MKRFQPLDYKAENKLKQIILSDLISLQFHNIYKIHAQKMISWIKIISHELDLSQSEQKVLITASYAYHWGCGNIFNQPFAHRGDFASHNKNCFQLASSKIERFLGYHLSRYFSQNEMLMICDILEDQAKDISKMSALAAIHYESALIAWADMLADNGLPEKYVTQVREFLATTSPLVINCVSKQILATF